MERRKSQINNDFYEELAERWLYGQDHPIALLRAENKARNPWILETIEKLKGKKAKILDIGCGGGILTNTLAKYSFQVFGVDLSSKSLEIAKKHDLTRSVTYFKASADNLPFPDQSFDVVCAMDLLEHVQNPSKVIEESSRVLKRDGLFFFHTFNRNLFSYLFVIKGVEWFIPNAPLNMHVYPLFIKPIELKKMCSKVFLEIQEYKGLNPKIFHPPFWKLLLTKTIDENFKFCFSKSLIAGYLGFAKKINQP